MKTGFLQEKCYTLQHRKGYAKLDKEYNYITPLESIEDTRLIEQQLCEYVVQMTKKDGSEYKATTIKQAVDRINRYISKNGAICGFNLHDKYQFPNLHNILNGKMKDLQEKRLGKKEGSMALIAQQVKEILNNEFLDPKMSQVKIIQEGNAHQIHLLANPPDTSIWYSKNYCDINRVRNFMKEIGQKIKVKLPDGILTNYTDIPEDAIMHFTGHKSVQGVHVYKNVNEHQQINTINYTIYIN
ncbi:26067_t:CDS:2 [Gigaspora margarita]|uniref:26067_t:CDS:1 n=1 Tax=Gigaspora margarita TaxID=4874 RepID=A0ABN7VCF0_GIGMA|nr:26067_t:CDS:2 [Gigaspora margarita]